MGFYIVMTTAHSRLSFSDTVASTNWIPCHAYCIKFKFPFMMICLEVSEFKPIHFAAKLCNYILLLNHCSEVWQHCFRETKKRFLNFITFGWNPKLKGEEVDRPCKVVHGKAWINNTFLTVWVQKHTAILITCGVSYLLVVIWKKFVCLCNIFHRALLLKFKLK